MVVILNKKLRYREEHSASVVLSWCTLTFIGRQTTDQQLINHLYETGHKTYRIPAKFRKIMAITPFKVIDFGTDRKPIYDFLI